MVFKDIKECLAQSVADHKEGKAVIVVVMSHGGPGFVQGIDGGQVSIEKDIVSVFDGVHAPRLRGVPKLFLIQACRGRREYTMQFMSLTSKVPVFKHSTNYD